MKNLYHKKSLIIITFYYNFSGFRISLAFTRSHKIFIIFKYSGVAMMGDGEWYVYGVVGICLVPDAWGKHVKGWWEFVLSLNGNDDTNMSGTMWISIIVEEGKQEKQKPHHHHMPSVRLSNLYIRIFYASVTTE